MLDACTYTIAILGLGLYCGIQDDLGSWFQPIWSPRHGWALSCLIATIRIQTSDATISMVLEFCGLILRMFATHLRSPQSRHNQVHIKCVLSTEPPNKKSLNSDLMMTMCQTQLKYYLGILTPSTQFYPIPHFTPLIHCEKSYYISSSLLFFFFLKEHSAGYDDDTIKESDQSSVQRPQSGSKLCLVKGPPHQPGDDDAEAWSSIFKLVVVIWFSPQIKKSTFEKSILILDSALWAMARSKSLETHWGPVI